MMIYHDWQRFDNVILKSIYNLPFISVIYLRYNAAFRFLDYLLLQFQYIYWIRADERGAIVVSFNITIPHNFIVPRFKCLK